MGLASSANAWLLNLGSQIWSFTSYNWQHFLKFNIGIIKLMDITNERCPLLHGEWLCAITLFINWWTCDGIVWLQQCYWLKPSSGCTCMGLVVIEAITWLLRKGIFCMMIIDSILNIHSCPQYTLCFTSLSSLIIKACSHM